MRPEISGDPTKVIFSTIYPLVLTTLISPSSESYENSNLPTYNKSEELIEHAIGPNLP